MIKILIAEDNHPWRDILKRHLSVYGFEVDGVDQSLEVMKHLQKNSYGLLICNAWQGSLVGHILCESVRRSELSHVREIPILMVAPEPLEQEDYKNLRRNDVYFMVKYKSPEKWYQKINVILGQPVYIGK